MFDKARNRVVFALISGFVVCVVRKSFLERFVLVERSKNGRFVSVSAKIWICGLYIVFRKSSAQPFMAFDAKRPMSSV